MRSPRDGARPRGRAGGGGRRRPAPGGSRRPPAPVTARTGLGWEGGSGSGGPGAGPAAGRVGWRDGGEVGEATCGGSSPRCLLSPQASFGSSSPGSSSPASAAQHPACLPAVRSLRVLPAALLSCLVAFLAQRLHVTNSRLREFPEEGMRAEGSSPGSRRS